jgi:predicted kinase
MTKLIVLQGTPCSGKTTWRNEYMSKHTPDTTVVVCRDEIRLELNNGKYSMDNEKEVSRYETSRIIEGINLNKDVIIDATNLNPKTIKKWEDLAKEYNCEIEYVKFYIPYAEAMKRSKKRKEEGGLYISKKVMMDFYRRYFPDNLREEFTDKRIIRKYQPELPSCVICDLDGTLALHCGRDPFEWDKIPSDKIDERLRLTLLKLLQAGSEIIFVTGRNAEAREATIKWLNEHLGTLNYKLYTREPNEFIPGEEYKKRIYQEYIENKYNVTCVFEDSDRCVEMWRSLGLLTCQVDNNDY